jgi:hypothetical protein
MDEYVVHAPSIDGQSIDGQSIDGQSIDGQSIDGQSIDGQSIDGQSIGESIRINQITPQSLLKFYQGDHMAVIQMLIGMLEHSESNLAKMRQKSQIYHNTFGFAYGEMVGTDTVHMFAIDSLNMKDHLNSLIKLFGRTVGAIYCHCDDSKKLYDDISCFAKGLNFVLNEQLVLMPIEQAVKLLRIALAFGANQDIRKIYVENNEGVFGAIIDHSFD